MLNIKYDYNTYIELDRLLIYARQIIYFSVTICLNIYY